jgi:ribosomal protein S18 acetylase RimI-like enzyme
MPEIVIRPATERDLDALCRLYYAFHQFIYAGLPDRLVSLGDPDQFDRTYLNNEIPKIIARADAALLVAEVQGQVVGLAEIYLRYDDPAALKVKRTYVYLQSLMVQEQFRRHGIGQQLIQAVKAWARQQAAIEIRLHAWESKACALSFYEKLGYHTLMREMVSDL